MFKYLIVVECTIDGISPFVYGCEKAYIFIRCIVVVVHLKIKSFDFFYFVTLLLSTRKRLISLLENQLLTETAKRHNEERILLTVYICNNDSFKHYHNQHAVANGIVI
ncbi:hypothetical protein M514_04838 [Trichuris suis]|uniref:Uncharacterized protein n=1 Tax=Trichuris suis TaxID=68888 RepID=A0A085MAQ0_9BILA|nr:hypothetical protein M513_04838 [Trichuris suis]KFD73149.1 hypothetical protein M514_04838 [Trichuris suis]